jgi:hypothetical protein
LAAPAELWAGTALVGVQVFCQWPLEGGVQGLVHCVCKRASFSHVVGYTAALQLGDGEANSLLDVASHGPAGRWHVLRPTGRPAGARRRGGGRDA